MERIIYFVFVASLILFFYKQNRESREAANATSELYSNEGNIKGTLECKTSDGMVYSKDFDYQLNFGEPIYTINKDSSYTIVIHKGDASATTAGAGNQDYLKFTLASDLVSLKSLDEFDFIHDLDTEDKKITRFQANYMHAPLSQTKMKLEHIYFDPAHGIFSADYVIHVDSRNNQSGNQATISGSIDSKIAYYPYTISQK
jgi:hypothetical protein